MALFEKLPGNRHMAYGWHHRAEHVHKQGISQMAGGPPPLRSDSEPDGLCGLSFEHQQRVNIANALYMLTTRIINFCFVDGLFFVENPFSSIYWKTTAFGAIE